MLTKAGSTGDGLTRLGVGSNFSGDAYHVLRSAIIVNKMPTLNWWCLSLFPSATLPTKMHIYSDAGCHWGIMGMPILPKIIFCDRASER